ncbi:hypothetical protein ACTJJ0_10065 [Chitinophaga sp. 22321]|uniref:Uncharacterized protein n=1 Tax=Chitinophaga hostae TaxID=2831022 RepID=A0ABS5ISK5_9BACT|nr:hypothetical protein [Chitinophaga hostae]MBS0025891.1 hypothetical protein [Chitinophaga hostae]
MIWRWMVFAAGIVLVSNMAFAQTFKLKPVKLLPAVKTTYPPPTQRAVSPVYMMAPDTYYRQHFGFFCKQEWTWQKRTGLPVKVRLGNYSYTQQLEGKH